MTYPKPYQTHDDEASLLLTSVTASSAPSFSFGPEEMPATKKNGVPTMRAMIAAGVLLGTLAVIYSGSRGGGGSSSTANWGTVAVVTSDDSCATEVPGAGPCCEGQPVDTCSRVCDWLLRCDEGYVPELTDDTATVFPETSDYQPYNCQCRGFQDPGCFCRQVRDMVIKFSNGGVTGDCDPCLPPPTPAPTTPVYDPFHDYCFFDAYIEQFCWYPTQDYHVGNWRLHQIGGTTIDDTCGPKCPPPPPPPPPPVYDPSHGFCFADTDNAGKYCWYPSDNTPDGNWKGEGGHAPGDCGDLCTDVAKDPQTPCLPATDGDFTGISQINGDFIQNLNPFQTCYQYGDEAKYCWSNSYYDESVWIVYGGWFQCVPIPYDGDSIKSPFNGWHAIEQKNMRYVNPPPQSKGDPYTCGLGSPACQKVKKYSGSQL